MFVFGNFFQAVASVLDLVLNLYFWIVIISALLSWVNPDPYNPIVRILNSLTQPVFSKVRQWMPFTYFSGLDLSPVVVLLVIQFLRIFIVRSLFQMGASI